MRISDWSSDVCSSDLLRIGERRGDIDREAAVGGKAHRSLRRNAALARARLQRRDLEPARGEAALQLHIRQPRAERLVDVGEGIGTHHAVEIGRAQPPGEIDPRSEEQTSELQSLMRTSYAVFC